MEHGMMVRVVVAGVHVSVGMVHVVHIGVAGSALRVEAVGPGIGKCCWWREAGLGEDMTGP